MKYLLIGLLASALLASATMFATQSRQTFSGTITDDECPSADHSGMRMGSTDAACTIACVDDHSVQFVLFDGKATYRLSPFSCRIHMGSIWVTHAHLAYALPPMAIGMTWSPWTLADSDSPTRRRLRCQAGRVRGEVDDVFGGEVGHGRVHQI